MRLPDHTSFSITVRADNTVRARLSSGAIPAAMACALALAPALAWGKPVPQWSQSVTPLDPAQEAPLEEPEASPDLDDMLDTPPDDQNKVFSSEIEIELKNQDTQTLFELLQASASEQEAQPIEAELLKRFHTSGSPTADLLLQRALLAIRDKKTATALDLMNSITILKPDFAEAWNKRARIHFSNGDLGKSLSDIERTLALEPRHFGALNGLAMILQRLDEDDRALEIYDRLLVIHPHMKDAREARDSLRERLDGRRT